MSTKLRTSKIPAGLSCSGSRNGGMRPSTEAVQPASVTMPVGHNINVTAFADGDLVKCKDTDDPSPTVAQFRTTVPGLAGSPGVVASGVGSALACLGAYATDGRAPVAAFACCF